MQQSKPPKKKVAALHSATRQSKPSSRQPPNRQTAVVRRTVSRKIAAPLKLKATSCITELSRDLVSAINTISTPERAIEYLELLGEYRVSSPGEYISIVPDAKDILAQASIVVLRNGGYDAPTLVSEEDAPEYAKKHMSEAPEAWFILRRPA